MFEITKDNIAQEGEQSRVGMQIDTTPQYAVERLMMGEARTLPGDPLPRVDFRLRDEDNEIHYEGWLHDDDDCANQIAAQRFGESDTGAWIIEVKRDGEWKAEIA